MGTVRVEDHHYPPGEEFTIPGIGLVKNFEDTEVDEIQIANFKALGSEWPEGDTLTIVSQDVEESEEQPVESVEEGTPADESTGGEG